MIDEILTGIFGEMVFGRLGRSARAQLLARFFFGLIGAALGVAGAAHFVFTARSPTNIAMHASMVGVFLFLACFSLLNVALARPWRWPGKLLIASFIALFLSRVLLGR